MEESNDKKEGISRRDFLLSAANVAILSVIGIFIGFPVVEIFLSHTGGKTESGGFVPVAKLSELKSEKPIQKAIVATQYDAWNKLENVNMGSVWMVKEDNGEIKAFSSICPHLGCIYGFNTGENIFVCPCHVSGFSLEGKRLKGPSPRDLDRLEMKIEGDEILVRYQKFISGIPQKKVV